MPKKLNFVKILIICLVLCVSLILPSFHSSAIAQIIDDNDETNTTVYKNKNYTVVIANYGSWSGENNTGDLTYWGCNTSNQCINLRHGKVNERSSEEMAITWKNGDYSYVFTTDVVEYIPTLRIYKNSTEILFEKDFSLLPYSNS